MAAIAAISLKNYAAAEQTYNPIQSSPVCQWVEAGYTSLDSQKKASLGMKMPKNVSTGVVRIQGKVTYPVLDAVTGALSHTPLGSFELVFPPKATLTERRECFARFKDYLADAVIQTAIEELALPY
jgi:hypothetical protein